MLLVTFVHPHVLVCHVYSDLYLLLFFIVSIAHVTCNMCLASASLGLNECSVGLNGCSGSYNYFVNIIL